MQNNEIVCDIGKDFILPNHTEHLKAATKAIADIRKRLNILIYEQNIDRKTHEQLFEETITILYYVGQLSQPLFDIKETLEEKYKMTYLRTPQLGKELFWEHYEKLHYQYSLLKNRCFKLIDDLDTEYLKCNKKCPPNWIN